MNKDFCLSPLETDFFCHGSQKEKANDRLDQLRLEEMAEGSCCQDTAFRQL